jgi:hypothetical protein
MCLPMPVDDYSRETFYDLDAWRSRFLALVAAGVDRLQLSDIAGVPQWLQGTATNEWERGNRWVLQLAVSAGAPRVSLIAVWDGEEVGDSPGGVAHMIQIARATRSVEIELIKVKHGIVSHS